MSLPDDPAGPDDRAGAAPATGDGAAPSDRLAELLQFPTDFPIKVMGRNVEGFAAEIVRVVLKHAPDFDPATLEMRPSRKGTYLGLTPTIRAVSREQLDALYRELTAHPMVKVVL
jgi:putative lipoic acid-binding regulatory protein